jgi:putative ubiquitin-RnfH superfamily antitoxin RatB of RatAB toxin-antitoxin module
MAEPTVIRVTVAFSPQARRVHQWHLTLEPGATVSQALMACGVLEEYPAVDLASARCGVWGRKATMAQALRDLDRVEIYRALRVDPKVARRQRFVKQGAGRAGLFAGRRPGVKGNA